MLNARELALVSNQCSFQLLGDYVVFLCSLTLERHFF